MLGKRGPIWIELHQAGKDDMIQCRTCCAGTVPQGSILQMLAFWRKGSRGLPMA